MDKNIEKIILDSKMKKHEKLSNILKYIFVDIAAIDQTKYFILGSYAIRDSRQISDLDINLDNLEFLKLERVIANNMGKIEFYNGQIRWFFDLTNEYNKLTKSNENDFSVEAFQKMPHEGFPNKSFSLKELYESNGLDTDPNGHQHFSLETLLKWKEAMNRPKDQDDIVLLKSLLLKKIQRSTRKKSSRSSSKKHAKKGTKKERKNKTKTNSKKRPKKLSKRK
jgi:hypothetical protein